MTKTVIPIAERIEAKLNSLFLCLVRLKVGFLPLKSCSKIYNWPVFTYLYLFGSSMKSVSEED